MDHMKRASEREDLKFAGDQYNQLKAKLYEIPRIIVVHDPAKKPEHDLDTWRVTPAGLRLPTIVSGHLKTGW